MKTNFSYFQVKDGITPIMPKFAVPLRPADALLNAFVIEAVVVSAAPRKVIDSPPAKIKVVPVELVPKLIILDATVKAEENVPPP